MSNGLAHRLSAQDAAFLYFERPNAPLHIGSVGIYEGQIPYERFLVHLNSRFPMIPRYRQRLAFVPFNLLHPTWEDDPQFDIRNHVHLITLSSPGTDDQLRELAGKIFAEPLDRSKPLWQMHVVQGLEGERSALIAKVHHCLVDGVSGIGLLMATVDISPEPAPPPEPQPWQPKEFPSPVTRMLDAIVDNAKQQQELWQEMTRALAEPLAPLRRAQDISRAVQLAAPGSPQPAPRTHFNVWQLSRDRRVAFSDMSFVEIREIRTALGGTVNDVVLTILAGALRRYLAKHDFDVQHNDLRVAVPVNVRAEGEDGAFGNRVSCVLPMLPLNESDPVRRLQTVRERMDTLKQQNQAGGLELLSRLATYVPTPIQVLTGFATTTNWLVNLVCTNVPGPMIPLYCVGHKMIDHFPLVPISLGMGLAVGVTSYNHRLYFGLMCDPTVVRDIDLLKQYLDEAFLELRAAAGVAPTDLPAFEDFPLNYEPVAATD
jgi:WS/DGAT/MGAT family acyltransferase